MRSLPSFIVAGIGLAIWVLGAVVAIHFHDSRLFWAVTFAMGLRGVVFLRHGLRARKAEKLSESAGYLAAEAAFSRIAHARANIEEVRRTLPTGFTWKAKSEEYGYVLGEWRNFERHYFEGPEIAVTVEVVDGDVTKRSFSPVLSEKTKARSH